MHTQRSVLRRVIVIAIVASIVLSILGFLVAPPIVKSQLVKRLSVELGRPVRIESVRINPWVLSVAIQGLAITDRDGGAFVAWDRIYVNFDSFSFFVKEWRFQEVTAVAPSGRVVVNQDRSLNFSDLLQKFAAKPAPVDRSPAWPLRVGKLVVVGAQLDFADHSRSQEFATHVGPVNLSLLNFYTAPNRDAPYQFTAETGSGEKLRWAGTVSVNPLASEGELLISGIQPATYAPYYRDLVRFDVLGGVLDVSGRYKATLGERGLAATMESGHVHLTALKVAPRGSTASALELADLEITGLEASTMPLTVKATKVALFGGRASVHRSADGVIDLVAMMQPVGPPAGTAPVTPTAGDAKPKPQVDIGAVSVRQFNAVFEDLATPRRAVNTIDNAEVDLEKVTLADGAAIPVKIALSLPAQGAINLHGSIVLAPLQATLSVDAANVSLATISPYIEPMFNVHITQGAVSAKGDVHAALPANAPMELDYTGSVTVDRLGLVDGVGNEPLAGWSQLAVNGIEFKATPLSLAVKDVTWTDPTAHVVIGRDHAINLLEALKPAPAPAGTATAAPTPAVTLPATSTPPKISIGKVSVTNGAFTFVDRSVQPEVSTAVTQFGGTITGLSSENVARANVDLKATVDGGGPIAITGKLDPLGEKKSVDLKVDFKDVELTPFSPYSAKFAGYELARGKLFLDVNAKVAEQKVDMSNVVTLTQFTFGAPSQSPEATKLPVRLAVALLKDTDGKITIDLPVEGSLDDPSFRVGRVVMRVIVNLLTKAATSPFSMLGAMFGGGGEELAFQDFAPADAELTPDNVKKLETLTKALSARPGLSLEITGSFDPAADAYELKQRRLATMIRSRLWDDRRALDAHTPPPDQLVVTPEDELAITRKLFAEKFQGAVFQAPVPTAPPPMAAPEPPPQKKGFFRRATDVVTLKSWRDHRAEKKEEAALPPPPLPEPTTEMAGPPLAEMKARLADAIDVTNDDLRRLAASRAQGVRDYFVQHQIAGERLFLANVPTEGKGARVFLQLQ